MNISHRIEPGQAVHLGVLPTDGKLLYEGGKAAAKEELNTLRDELAELQHRLYSEGKRKMLVVFQAMDAGGKDGTIRAVFQGVNPQGVQVTPFKAPTKEELDRDFLWRIHKAVPGKGMIGVFNRSHYEDVLVVRVENMVPEGVWRPRYDFINQFEKLLYDTGTTILKFYLHISKEEQKKRFQERLDDPAKNWKFSHEDVEKRKQWELYMTAYEEMLSRCSTAYAPWYVIPANQNWYRNLTIARILVETLREMNPQYPQGEDLRDVVLE